MRNIYSYILNMFSCITAGTMMPLSMTTRNDACRALSTTQKNDTFTRHRTWSIVGVVHDPMH